MDTKTLKKKVSAIAIYELEVFKRTEELLNKIYPVLVNYPKSEKFALCQEIKQNFYKLLVNISLGNSVKSRRRTYLQELVNKRSKGKIKKVFKIKKGVIENARKNRIIPKG